MSCSGSDSSSLDADTDCFVLIDKAVLNNVTVSSGLIVTHLVANLSRSTRPLSVE